MNPSFYLIQLYLIAKANKKAKVLSYDLPDLYAYMSKWQRRDVTNKQNVKNVWNILFNSLDSYGLITDFCCPSNIAMTLLWDNCEDKIKAKFPLLAELHKRYKFKDKSYYAKERHFLNLITHLHLLSKLKP